MDNKNNNKINKLFICKAHELDAQVSKTVHHACNLHHSPKQFVTVVLTQLTLLLNSSDVNSYSINLDFPIPNPHTANLFNPEDTDLFTVRAAAFSIEQPKAGVQKF